MNPNNKTLGILPNNSHEMPACSTLSTVTWIWHRFKPLQAPPITKWVLVSIRTAFLSCPLALRGFRNICHTLHTCRLLKFAMSSSQASWTAVKNIQSTEDRGWDRNRAYCSSMSNRIQPISLQECRRQEKSTFAFNMSSNLLPLSLPSPRRTKAL